MPQPPAAAGGSLDALLLEAARLSVAVRAAYAALKRDPAARYFTYVLLLQNGKMYVGNTDNIYQRLLEHCLMSPSAAVWVREHGPVARVVEICRNCTREDETYKTLEYMSLFGWEHVRGAAWCRPEMRAPPVPLAEFTREPRPFEYMTRRDMDGVLARVRELAAGAAAGAVSRGAAP